jgi:hypothetical protein
MFFLFSGLSLKEENSPIFVVTGVGKIHRGEDVLNRLLIIKC